LIASLSAHSVLEGQTEYAGFASEPSVTNARECSQKELSVAHAISSLFITKLAGLSVIMQLSEECMEKPSR
jgi:hypothetical protein